MTLDALLTAFILGAAVAFLGAGFLRSRGSRLAIPVAVAGVALVGLLALAAGPLRAPPSERQIAERPIVVPVPEYVSSDACRSCHPREYETWDSSHHSKMTQIATPSNVAAAFDGTELVDRYRYRLQTRGDELWVESNDPSFGGGGEWTERRVRLTTGSHHAQLYWVESDQGRKLELLPFGYRIAEQRWVPFLSAFLAPASDDPRVGLVETSWSQTCIRCHATNPRPRVEGPNKIDSHVSEFGIACEACHGPAEAHVEANRDPLRRYASYLGLGEQDSEIVDPSALSHERSSQVCAQCHSVSTEFDLADRRAFMLGGPRYRPGGDFQRARNVIRNDGKPQIPFVEAVLRGDPGFLEYSFWSDGEVAVSGREYNGLIDSPCYAAGELSCFSCHQLHQSDDDPRAAKEWANDQLAVGMNGNDACLQCHEDFADRIEEHTHHRANSSGSECMNCHMPNTAYGLLKATRSHQITNPNVASSVATGRPNACNACHLDQTLEWAAETQHAWWGTPIPDLPSDERSTAASLLWLLRGHAGQRALVVWSMGWQPARDASGTDWMTPFLARSLTDPYEAIRFLANRSLQDLPGWSEKHVDHTAPQKELERASWSATEDWLHSDRRRVGRALLIREDGTLMNEEIEQLASQRDERPVYRPE